MRAPVRALLVAAAGALAGCGSPAPEPALPDAEFVGRASVICGELDRRAQLAEDTLLIAEPELGDARRVLAGLAPVVALARDDMAELHPPKPRQPAYDSYLAALDQARARLEAMGRSDSATREQLSSDGPVLASLDPRERALGLTECASGTLAPAEQDDQVKDALGNALVAEQLIFAGDRSYSEEAADLRLIEPALRYEVGLEPSTPTAVTVKVTDRGQAVYLSSRSRSGTCFYLMAAADGSPSYATDAECGPADEQDYLPEW